MFASQSLEWLTSTLQPNQAAFSPAQLEVLKTVFTEFGQALGKTLGEKLCEQRAEMEIKFQCLSQTKSTASQDGVVTGVLEASRFDKHGVSKNQKRNMRRKRAKQKFAIQRSMLLQMRPSADIGEQRCALVSCKLGPCYSDGRIIELDKLVPCDVETSGDLGVVIAPLSGTPAGVLAQQCTATKVIQRGWRLYKARSLHASSLLGDFRTMPIASWRKVYSLFGGTSGHQDGRPYVDPNFRELESCIQFLLYQGSASARLKVYRFVCPQSMQNAGVAKTVKQWCFEEPKRPPAAFFIFANKAKAAYERELSRDELLDVQRQWKDLPANEKAVFVQHADELKLAYQQNLIEFNKKGKYFIFEHP